MTRELNVRITLSERSNFVSLSDADYALVIKEGLYDYTSNYNISVEVHTVTPESANPKEGECKWSNEYGHCNQMIGGGFCPLSAKEDMTQCKYYEPKREEK